MRWLAWMAAATLFATAGVQADDWYALEANPPAVAHLQEQRLLRRIPLDHAPSQAHLTADGRRLFVLCQIKARKGDPEGDRSQIVVADTSTGKVEKTLPVPGRVTNFGPLPGSPYWFAFGPGVSGNKKRRPIPAVALMMDGRTLTSRTFLPDGPASHAAWAPDLSRLFLLEEVTGAYDARITIFNPHADKRQAEVRLAHGANRLETSPDGKWLYAVDQGFFNHLGAKHLGMARGAPNKINRKLRRDGAVFVIETATGKLAATHPLGLSPWRVYADEKLGTVTILAYAADGVHGRLYELRGPELLRSMDLSECPQYLLRLPDLNGRAIVSYDELRFLSDEGDSKNFVMPLSPAKYGAAKPGSIDLSGSLGESLYVEGAHKLVAAVHHYTQLPDFEPMPKRDIVAVDLSSRQLKGPVTVGRSGVKIGRVAGQFALSMAIGMGTGTATSGFGAHSGVWVAPAFGNASGPPAGRMAASARGQHVYVLSRETNDVTILQTSDLKVIDKIAVGGGCFRIFPAAGGRVVVAHTDEDIKFLNTETNKVAGEFHLPKGKLLWVDEVKSGVVGQGAVVVALGSESITLFDAATGKQTGSIADMGLPIGIAAMNATVAATVASATAPVPEALWLAPPPPSSALSQAPAVAPAPEPAPARATAIPAGEVVVHFFRPPEDDYNWEKPPVLVDGVVVAKLPVRSYFTARLRPGVRKIQAVNKKGKALLVDFNGGTEYFIQIKVKFTANEITQIEPRFGEAIRRDYKPIEQKWVVAADQVIDPKN